MKVPLLLAALLLGGAAARAEVFPRGTLVERVATRADPSQTYALYLPSTFDASPSHPVLLVFDPRGRAVQAAEIFRPAAERFGWVVVSWYDTRSDGLGDNNKALRALWPEVSRHAPDPRRVYAAGFSGGGILTLLLGLGTGAVAGVIDVGGRLPDGLAVDKATFAHFGTAGRADFNALPMRELDRAFARAGRLRRLDFFDGGHQWLSAEHAARAVAWLEIVAMAAGTRPRDPALVESTWSEERHEAAELLRAGRVREAIEHEEMLARTFEPLRAVDEARVHAKALRDDRRTADLLRDDAKAEQEEKNARHRESAAEALLRRDPAPTAGALRGALGLDELQKAAARGGPRGEAAQRVLESVFSHMSFYLANEFLTGGDLRRSVLVLEIANEIRPKAPAVEFNLACALARAGDRRAALAALERAVAEGWSDAGAISADPDLKPLREEPAFQALLRRLAPG